MSDLWVVNASPIIVLAKANALQLLDREGERVVVPVEVANEIRRGPANDPARRAVTDGAFEQIEKSIPLPPAIAEWGLGYGESAVLAWARERQGVALVDDGQARRCARALGIRVMGTLGLIVRTRREGRIDSAAAVLHELVDVGLRLRNDVIARVLRDAVDEKWVP